MMVTHRRKTLHYLVTLVGVIALGDFALPTAQGSENGRGLARNISPRCCTADYCLSAHEDVHFAVVTSIRSVEYLVSLRDMHCSLRQTNSDLPLVVLGITNEMQNDVGQRNRGFREVSHGSYYRI